MYSKSLKKKSFVSNRKLFNLLKIKKSECKFKKKKLVQKKIWKKNILEDWEFISSINETIPAYFLRPRGDGPFPTIIYCHAHGGTYDKGRVESLVMTNNPFDDDEWSLFKNDNWNRKKYRASLQLHQ
tara:strand:- start:261 stop:641 length:381 start_codon:yes stop_codon:yes gene_type:complete